MPSRSRLVCMTDDEIRELLRPLADRHDAGRCIVTSDKLDPAMDWSPLEAWVWRQNDGRVITQRAIDSKGLRPGRRVAAPGVPASKRFEFPCSALDPD